MTRHSRIPGDPTETVADLFGITEELARLRRIEADTANVGDLSGGETTRVRLAALFYDDPDIVLLDEPTNNLDTDGRKAVRRALAGWSGTAIVASHDRILLEEMDAIVELDPLGART